MTIMADRPFTVVKRNDLTPLCPHCGEELPEVYVREAGFPLIKGLSKIYFCPHCRKTLGLSESRMV
jgi:hypothetical protein